MPFGSLWRVGFLLDQIILHIRCRDSSFSLIKFNIFKWYFQILVFVLTGILGNILY